MNTKTNTNTKTARIVLGILAGARSISVRTDAKTGKTSRREILSNWHCEVYFVNAKGETVKHCPLAHFNRSLDIIPTGTRDRMIIWTLETARKLNFGVKPCLNCLSAECSIESLAYFRPYGQGGREQNLTAGGFTNPHQKK